MECIFCKIVQNKIPADIIYRDADFIVFKDINPHAPIHYLIVPSEHIVQPLKDKIDPKTTAALGKIFFLSKKIAKILDTDNNGWRLVQNNGKDAGQVIEHFHIHFLAGKKMRM